MPVKRWSRETCSKEEAEQTEPPKATPKTHKSGPKLGGEVGVLNLIKLVVISLKKLQPFIEILKGWVLVECIVYIWDYVVLKCRI